MDIRKLYPKKYIEAADIGDKPVRLIMREIKQDEFPVQGTSKREKRGILYFQKARKGIILTDHNVNVLVGLYGTETDAWMGKPATLYVEHDVRAFGKSFNVVRVMSDPDQDSGPPPGMTDEEPPPDAFGAPPDDIPEVQVNADVDDSTEQPEMTELDQAMARAVDMIQAMPEEEQNAKLDALNGCKKPSEVESLISTIKA